MDECSDAAVDAPRSPSCLGWESEPAGLSEVARRRRDEVMDAAEAIIAGQGIDQLSLARIEERAGMSRGQLTYYFPTKESILLAVHERMLRRMIREFTASDGPKPMTGRAWECFRYVLGGHLGLHSGNPFTRSKDLFSLLYTFLAQMGHREDYRNRLSEMNRARREMIATDIAQSVPEPRFVPPEIAASLLQGLLHGLAMQLTVDPQAFDREAMFKACVSLLEPIFSDSRPHAAKSETIP